MGEDDWLFAHETLAPASQFLMTETLPGFDWPVLMVVATSAFCVASIAGKPFRADDCFDLAGAVASELMRYPPDFVSALLARVVFCGRLLYMDKPRSMVWDDHTGSNGGDKRQDLFVDAALSPLVVALVLHHELGHIYAAGARAGHAHHAACRLVDVKTGCRADFTRLISLGCK